MVIAALVLAALAQEGSFAPATLDEGRLVLDLACLDCHSGANAEAGVDLERMSTSERPAVDLFDWRRVRGVVEASAMPPGEPLDASEREPLLALLEAVEVEALEQGGAAGHEPVRRLTRGELGRTLEALTGVRVDVERLLPAELLPANGFETNAATLTVHADWLERARVAAALAVEDSPLVAAGFEPQRFLRRAYRRPARADELARLRARRAQEVRAGATEDEALRRALSDVLTSPHVLLRLEDAALPDAGGSVVPGGERAVGPFGLASRLSFLVWGGPPDDALLDLADAGALSSEEVLAEQLERLLADPRALAFGRTFAGQWLGTHQLGTRVKPDPIDNPRMTDALLFAMRDEVARFVLALFAEGRPLEDLLAWDVTFVTPELARFYGLRVPVGAEEGEVLRIRPIDARRRGLLGKAGVLACTSYPDRTSPVLRGAWILEDLLGTPPPPPPPGASEVDEELLDEVEGSGPRALLERHRASQACASCHAQIDPLGLALEGFDRFGETRADYPDGGRVDTQGRLPSGTAFRGPSALARVLLAERRGDLAREVARRLLAFALGRSLTWQDEREVVRLAGALDEEGFGALLRALTTGRPFRYVTEPPPPSRDESSEDPDER